MVVNEAVEVCKLFGAEEGHKFVNGIVDKLAANIRHIEYKKDNPDKPGGAAVDISGAASGSESE